jgi:hypothetical protein
MPNPHPDQARGSTPTGSAVKRRLSQAEVALVAEKVYRLLLAELRLEQARGAGAAQHEESR